MTNVSYTSTTKPKCGKGVFQNTYVSYVYVPFSKLLTESFCGIETKLNIEEDTLNLFIFIGVGLMVFVMFVILVAMFILYLVKRRIHKKKIYEFMKNENDEEKVKEKLKRRRVRNVKK